MSDEIERRIGDLLAETLKEAGVVPAKIAQRVSEALDAERVVRIHAGNGEVLEYKDPDHLTRLSAVDRALNLSERAGLVPAPAARVSGGNAPITVNVVVLRPDG